MTKKLEKAETSSHEACKCWEGCCCGGKILLALLALVWAVAAIMACIYACKASKAAEKLYDFNVLSAGGQENFNRMTKVYESQGYVDYMAQYAQQGEDQFGLSEDNSEPSDSKYASLDSLRDIAVELGTDQTALQTCIDEWRYTQAVNDMMDQAYQLFWVSGTPGNVIVFSVNYYISWSSTNSE